MTTIKKVYAGLLLGLAGLAGEVRAVEPKPAAHSAAETHFQLSDLLPRGLQKNPRLDLSIITEVTAEGHAIAAPTTEHPAYYIVLDGGLVEEGDVVAGERPPPPAALARLMEKSLAGSGYLPATKANPPTLVIHYRWGIFNHLSAVVDDGTPEMAELKNVMVRAALVGGTKFAVDLLRAANTNSVNFFRLRDDRTDALVSMAGSDLYFLLATAYDYQAALQNQKKLLWTTKISTDSQGLAMDETLPALVTSAKTYFGHDTGGAVLFHPRLYEGKVEIGEATVTGYDVPLPGKATGAPAKK